MTTNITQHGFGALVDIGAGPVSWKIGGRLFILRPRRPGSAELVGFSSPDY